MHDKLIKILCYLKQVWFNWYKTLYEVFTKIVRIERIRTEPGINVHKNSGSGSIEKTIVVWVEDIILFVIERWIRHVL